jgi:hypothetical protein
VISNISLYGCDKSLLKKTNKFKLTFKKNNKITQLFDSFKIIISHQPQLSIQKDILDHISISVCRLLKSQKPSPIYSPVLIYVNELKSSPSPTTGYDYPLAAQIAWNKMIDAEKYL